MLNDIHILKAVQAEGDSDFQWVTNFVIQPGYYDNEDNMKGLDRYQQIYEQLCDTDGTVSDEKAAMDVLASVGRRNFKPQNGHHLTIHSAVYYVTHNIVYWVPKDIYHVPAAWLYFAL